MDFYDFSSQYKVQVRFIELMPFESSHFKYEDYYISKEEILQLNPTLEFVSKLNNVEFYNTKSNSNLIGFINAISNKFCESCNRIRLTSDGHLKPCLHSSEEIFIKDKTNEEIVNKLKEAVRNKPKQHALDTEYKNQAKRSMNKIGG